MIFDISDENFKRIMNEEHLYLPIRWDGVDFSLTLDCLFNYYIKQLEITCDKNEVFGTNIRVEIKEIKRVTGLLIKAVNHYLNGFPSKSYATFERVMDILMKTPLRIYQKSVIEQFDNYSNQRLDDDLKLFRVVSVNDNRPYNRERVFHTPYNLRSKVSTSRYSIAGYPSLYLGTSLALCCEEIHMNPYNNFALASKFELERTVEYTNTNIQVIELGVKPQDFFLYERPGNESFQRYIPRSLLEQDEVRFAYLLWYPLIAACSFIRTNKNDPFAAEYIIPQLLMQWVRSEMGVAKYEDCNQLIGIRYFSCASVKASDMGFNYVFPTSGKQKSANLPYCSVLAKAFRLTSPKYIHEYDDIRACEWYLNKLNDFDFIG